LLHRHLGAIQPELLRAFEGKAVIRNYRKAAAVYRRGRAVRGIFLVRKGRVKVLLEEGPSGLALHVAGPGSVLGLGETMSGAAYDASVETLEDCEIAFLPREEFLRYLRTNCDICLQLVQLLSEDLHVLYQQYRTVGGPATRRRKPQSHGPSRPQTPAADGPN
jgi:CRP/FNR family transcriptional regulator